MLWWVLSPLVRPLLKSRASRGKEDTHRLPERFGRSSLDRPQGQLIWVHGASVGECLAALPLVERLLQKPGRSVLVTSGTVTSARILEQRLPPGAFHQYAPIDRRDVVAKFLTHWRPDLALFFESDLWPNRVVQTREAGVPIALVNARLSSRSFKGWQRFPGAARRLFASIDVCLAQDARVAENLRSLGARTVSIAGSLKADASPLPCDEQELDRLRALIGDRPLFLAAQTHRGEDEIVLQAARNICDKEPDTLTIIVPRHPDRGGAIALLAEAQNFKVERRAMGARPSPDTQIYVADTLGELGLFYRLVQIVFLGGSLLPQGGHNPIEPALLGASVLTGPHVENFEETFRALLGAQENTPINSADELSEEVCTLLSDPQMAAARGEKAKSAVSKMAGALERTLKTAEELLSGHARA
jgi:3-deoxy-D-manno-octulosonic-acid transferase